MGRTADNSFGGSDPDGGWCAERIVKSISTELQQYLFYRDIWIPLKCNIKVIVWKNQISAGRWDSRRVFIEEQTRIGGVSYLLVSDSMEDEASAYILKDVSKDTDPEACYEMLEDEDELQAVYKVFEQMLEDVDFEM